MLISSPLIRTNARMLTVKNRVENIHISRVYGTYYQYCIALTKYYPGEVTGFFDGITLEHICASKAERLEVYCKAKSRVCSIIWVQSKCRVGQLRISDLHRREQITPIETIQIGKEAIVDCLVLEDIRTENLTGEKMPKYGDVITIQASDYEQTEKWGTNWLTKEFQSGIPALIRNVGNVLENGTTEMFTVTTENHNTSVWLTNAAGKKTTFFLDYLPEDSVFFSLKDGDQVMMYTNQGMPVIATEQAPLVLGDVNADGTLSIADVLALNRNLLAGAPLPALQNARSTELGYLDFDGDGTLTQADVLGMLKRVLGIG